MKDDTTYVTDTINLKRLLWLRTIAIAGAAVCLLVVGPVYGLAFPVVPLLIIIGVIILVNIATWRRLVPGYVASDGGFFAQMLFDIAALSSVLYFTGGASNPFAFFFLLPVTITAVILPGIYIWTMAAIAVGCYTLLMRIRLPIPEFIPQSNQSISDLHVFGMWLGFVMIAGLMAHFVASMGKTLRDRDKQLAEAREQALRDERVVALATLAAGAAHELGTPLGTISVLAEEMADENPVDQHPELHENIDVLRSQIQRCKDALSVMSASAGATRADSVRSICVDNFVSDTVAQVRRLRPDCRIKIRPGSVRPAPAVVVEQTLTQAFLNVLHNAVDASPLDVVVEYNWTDADVNLVILDAGEGVVLESDDPVQWLGRSTKEGGLGLGLFLSYTAIRQAGGHISINRRPTGGTSVTINIPLPEAGTLSS